MKERQKGYARKALDKKFVRLVPDEEEQLDIGFADDIEREDSYSWVYEYKGKWVMLTYHLDTKEVMVSVAKTRQAF
ncbi:hypothetical protein J45TS6_35120 [Paenibacillus sp. J45TS6]|uniref:hypothetical protein n=1 Tax=Paenibacillus sp. J45TS6 TaxID=2807196 RepID=UPI001B141FA2|nr:hypothetical protein [Paenibacillus sp. J45TS6]GIP45053.1 hypothetical protein J45TS6_35120 [Paenibacillus sp. J45TS6]